MASDIIVVGAGIVGLSTAFILSEAGHRVSIYSRHKPMETTSSIAAAIWFPYAAYPIERVNNWSRASLGVYAAWARVAGSGVSYIDFVVLDQPNQAQQWMAALPASMHRPLESFELPEGYFDGFLTQVPLIETPLFLPMLQGRLVEMGVDFHWAEVSDLITLVDRAHWVVNCTGLGARALVADDEVYPIRGQIVKVAAQQVLAMADDHGPNALAYIVPRNDGVILGGTAEVGDFNLDIDDRATEDIVKRCRNLQPVLCTDDIVDVLVGLRPGRRNVRLEREAGSHVIHNYGHGGSGFTVCWGCAHEVLEIIRSADL